MRLRDAQAHPNHPSLVVSVEIHKSNNYAGSYYGKCSKISSTVLLLFSTKMLVISPGIHNSWNLQNACQNSLIRQSDLDLRCLSMPFWQVTSV